MHLIIVDTDSRDCPPESAEERVTSACRAIQASGAKLVYKKIDSTLRGNVGLELDVVRRELGIQTVVLAPAFPQMGRTTIGGYQLVDGVPVGRTAAGNGTSSSAFSNILNILAVQSSVASQLFSLDSLDDYSTDLETMAARTNGEHVVAVCDSVLSDNLEAVLSATMAAAPDALLCGSGGLAQCLANRMSESATGDGETGIERSTSRSGPVAVIAGSMHAATVGQVKQAELDATICVIRVDPTALVGATSASEANRVIVEGLDAADRGRHVLVAFSGEMTADELMKDGHESMGCSAIVKQLGLALGRIGSGLVKGNNIGGLVLTGGETAGQVVRALEATGTRLTDVVMEGVTKCTLTDGVHEGLPVIVKPGGFGKADALLSCIQRLHGPAVGIQEASKLPVMGITIGDPNGVGPEIIAKVFSTPALHEICRPMVVGHGGVMNQAIEAGSQPMRVRCVNGVGECLFEHGTMDVLDVDSVDVATLKLGTVQEAAGRLAVKSVIRATKLAMAGEIQAVVTAPLNKEAMNLAGYHYAGHTELLAELTGTDEYRLTLAFDGKLVSHVTTHVSLREAIEKLSEKEVIATVDIIGRALNRMGISDPVIAVAGLNPHAGEGGMFGDEEIRVISPALEKARAAGWNIVGPLPPDTVFLRAMRGEFDGIVGMYHDQGHIPVKAVAFDRSVNVSLGLPIIRTSVDHGTAFDIAGQGIANPENLLAAIEMAVRLAGDGWSMEMKNAPSTE